MLTGVVGVVRTGAVTVVVIVMAGGAEELAVLGHEGGIHGGKQ